MSHAGHNCSFQQTQLSTQMSPSAKRVLPLQKHLRKGIAGLDSEEWGKKIWKIALCTRSKKKEIPLSVGLRVPHVGAYGHALKKLQPTESPHRSRLLAGAMAHERSMLEQRKSVRKKEREREKNYECNTYSSTLLPIPPWMVCRWRKWQWRSKHEPRPKKKKKEEEV